MASIKVKFRPSTVADHRGTIYYQIIHERNGMMTVLRLQASIKASVNRLYIQSVSAYAGIWSV